MDRQRITKVIVINHTSDVNNPGRWHMTFGTVGLGKKCTQDEVLHSHSCDK